MRLFLDFDSNQDQICRARLSYAFKTFCAIYGHSALGADQAKSADVNISYADTKLPTFSKVVKLQRLYVPRCPRLPAPTPTHFEAFGEQTTLFYRPQGGGRPDWLAEIFEWLSCADEYSCDDRDGVGRLPFLKSYIGRHNLKPTLPYAAIAMRALQLELQLVASDVSSGPPRLDSSATHFIVNTHDVDYLQLCRSGSVKRLLRNAAISLVMRRCTKSAAAQVLHAVRVAGGGLDPLNRLNHLAEGESRRKVGASYFFIARRQHRRDANYLVGHPKVLNLMRSLERRGMEVGVHGSYTSFEGRHRLMEEFETLRSLGFNPRGHRAHWLRFTMDRIVDEIEATGALYDSSLGWSDTIGFRAGACFAFAPYNFKRERPANFLEIPLVAMDQCLVSRTGREQLLHLLGASRRFGWGGISVLWHPSAFGGGQFRKDVGDLFWHLVDSTNGNDDRWLSGSDFVASVRHRYQEVGLLD